MTVTPFLLLLNLQILRMFDEDIKKRKEKMLSKKKINDLRGLAKFLKMAKFKQFAFFFHSRFIWYKLNTIRSIWLICNQMKTNVFLAHLLRFGILLLSPQINWVLIFILSPEASKWAHTHPQPDSNFQRRLVLCWFLFFLFFLFR